MTTNAVRFATATLAQPMQAQPQQHRCPQCNGRGYVVRDILESDGMLYSITRDCDCKKREETRR